MDELLAQIAVHSICDMTVTQLHGYSQVRMCVMPQSPSVSVSVFDLVVLLFNTRTANSERTRSE